MITRINIFDSDPRRLRRNLAAEKRGETVFLFDRFADVNAVLFGMMSFICNDVTIV